MEWVEHGRYTIEPHHPPLARIADAIGPYLAGLRGQGRADMYEEGMAIISSSGDVRWNLVLARLGVLPFFLAACAAVYLLARRAVDRSWAVGATVCSSRYPGACTCRRREHDLPLTDARRRGVRARRVAGPDHYIACRPLGAACAGALLTKLSAVLFLPAAFAPVLVAWLTHQRGGLKHLVRPAPSRPLWAWDSWCYGRDTDSPCAPSRHRPSGRTRSSRGSHRTTG
jgi:hypothetical protein